MSLPFIHDNPYVTYDRQTLLAMEVFDYNDPTHGYNKWRQVYNPSAAVTLTKYRAVSFAAGSNLNVAASGAGDTRPQVAGVPQVDIPPETYGFVACGGQCYGESAAAFAAGGRLVIDTAANGTFDDDAVATEDVYVAIAVEAATGAGQAKKIRLDLGV